MTLTLIQPLIDQCHLLISYDNFERFEMIKNNNEGFKAFTFSTHCIGNFTDLSHRMNTGRYSISQDYLSEYKEIFAFFS